MRLAWASPVDEYDCPSYPSLFVSDVEQYPETQIPNTSPLSSDGPG